MRKILVAILMPMAINWLRRRYGDPHQSRGRSF